MPSHGSRTQSTSDASSPRSRGGTWARMGSVVDRIVIVSNVVPYDAIPHAGGQYMRSLVGAARELGELTLLAPDTPANRLAISKPGAPRQSTSLLGLKPGGGLLERVSNRAVTVTEQRLRAIDPGLAPRSFAVALLRDAAALDVVRRASVIDLQWAEMIRLVPLFRRINPKARVVGTFHDVQSQLFSREPRSGAIDSLRWQLAAFLARRHEGRALSALDVSVVFSEKDARLLGSASTVRVVRPPLPRLLSTPRDETASPTVLFVAHFARDENSKAVEWLLERVWPEVRSRVPAAGLRLVGLGLSGRAHDLSVASAGVQVAGFVENLELEFAQARVVAVPLLQGAGVKFKTVEALLAGVPVVTTSVGAEGIGPPDLYAAETDDPGEFADALVKVLLRPGDYSDRAQAAADWASRTFAPEGFANAIAAVYEG